MVGRHGGGSRTLLAILLTAFAVAPGGARERGVRMSGPVSIAAQGSFFIGGRDSVSDALSRMPGYARRGTLALDQVYVRYQIPARRRGPNLVLVHGCCLTGASWETTPDGRMGWDEYFVRGGYPTYVIDQAGRGRSATAINALNLVKDGQAPADRLPDVFAVGREDAWSIFRFGPRYPEPFPGQQFPVEAQDMLWKQMVPTWEITRTPNATVPALRALVDRIGRTILVSHSQSGRFPFEVAALDPRGIAGIVALEPGACPSATDDMRMLTGIPVLVVFGDFVEQSPRWAPRLTACRAFVAAARKAGADAELLELPRRGIHGNSHMLMQDRNSLVVADLLRRWMRRVR